jgi:drug/metabolite transporter (DMT)-like permease
VALWARVLSITGAARAGSKTILSALVSAETRSIETRGLLLAATSALFFGTLAILGKLGYEEGAGVLPLLAVRFAVATLLLALWHRVTKRPMMLPPRDISRLLVLGGLGYAFEATLFFLALEHAPAGVVGLIFYSYPLWTNLLVFLTGMERLSGRVLIALVLGSVGVASIFAVSETGLAGPLLALGAAVAVAVYFLLVQVVLADVPAPSAALWTSGGAAVTVGASALATGWELPVDAVPHALGLGLVSALAFALLYAAIARIGSSRSSIAQMVEPLTTVLLAWVVLGEELSLRIGVGAIFVISALPILARSGTRKVSPPTV